MRRKPLWMYIIAILLGAAIGSVLGQLLGLVLPEGVVREFFTRTATLVDFNPSTIGPEWLNVTFGFCFKINVTGIIGIFIATYIWRIIR